MAQHYSIKSMVTLKSTEFDIYDERHPEVVTGAINGFHLRFIESLSTCELYLNDKYVALAPYDVVLISSKQDVVVKNVGNVAELNVFTERLRAPSPLNLVLVGDNPMVHDLMNAGETEMRFIVYRHLDQYLNHRYFQLITVIEEQDLHDVFLDYQREMAVGLLMTELLRNHEETIGVSDSYFPGKDIRHASRDTQAGVILNYLVLHSQDATLKSTAGYFGYDKNYFSRLCRNLFNKSFTGQLAFIRIELAKRMLALSNKKIEEIAFELGYKNISSFFAIFKRNTEMTPKEWREQHGYRAITMDNN